MKKTNKTLRKSTGRKAVKKIPLKELEKMRGGIAIEFVNSVLTLPD